MFFGVDAASQRAVTDKDQGYKRSWLAIGIGTIVLLVSYSSLLVAIVATQSDTPDAAGPVFALGFALVPVTFVAVAFLSGRRRAPIAVLKAMGVWLLVALPFGLFNPVFGLCMGFGFGGMLTLKELDNTRWQSRLIAVLAGSTYAFAMLFVVPAIGLLSGGLLPFASLGLADYYTEHRAGDAAGRVDPSSSSSE
ncbi:MAG: hypothetical protein MUQ27_00345 [Acidimicrobiia bacterium]|nr:hypothetical protein [Acidimicrobiia bacterium]